MRVCELCFSVLYLPVCVQSGSAATRVRQRSQRDVQGVRLRSHDADVLVYDISLSSCCSWCRYVCLCMIFEGLTLASVCAGCHRGTPCAPAQPA